MIDAPWLKIAKRLPIGGSCRFRCCGNTKAGVLFNKPESWEGFCHRCKSNFYERKEYVRQQAMVVSRRELATPADLIKLTDTSATTQQAVYAFLAQKGLMPDMAGEILWSDTLRRVIFQVSSGMYLARAMTNQQSPKWVQLGGKSSFAYIAPKTQPVQGAVLTEDLLSAKKVAYASNHFGDGNLVCVSLLGTRLDSRLKLLIIEHNWPVLLMLDGDDAGYGGVKRIKRDLKAFPVRVGSFAVEGKDPKDLQMQEILEALTWMR